MQTHMRRHTFATPFGRCAIKWHDAGLTGFELPEARPQRGDEASPPGDIAAIVARVQRHLAGEPEDFSDLNYDFTPIAEFDRAVLRATLAIKTGRTRSYGEIAGSIGQSSAASRAVGVALGANRWPLLIPCHRVLAADGRMTGFSGPGGVATKAKLLALEGAQLL